MHKMEKILKLREKFQYKLINKFHDLHEEERLALYRLEAFEPDMDTALWMTRVPPLQLLILESYGFFRIADVIAIGWHQETFSYGKAKRILFDIPGIGPKTVDVLMEKIASILTTKEQRKKMSTLMKESPTPECDRAFFYKWGQRLCLQYEEVKQMVRMIRSNQRRFKTIK